MDYRFAYAGIWSIEDNIASRNRWEVFLSLSMFALLSCSVNLPWHLVSSTYIDKNDSWLNDSMNIIADMLLHGSIRGYLISVWAVLYLPNEFQYYSVEIIHSSQFHINYIDYILEDISGLFLRIDKNKRGRTIPRRKIADR